MSLPTYIKPNIKEWIQQFSFFSDLKVRVCETDCYGHANNTSFSLYYEQGRADFFETIQLYENDFLLVVGDIYIRYHQEAFVRDKLTVGVRCSEIGTKSIKLESVILRKSTQELISTSWATIVILDKKTKKTTAVPDVFKQLVQL